MLSPLRKARLLKELTIHDVTLLTGVDPSKISLIERGYKDANFYGQVKLAQALGVSIDEIFPENVRLHQGLR